MAKWATQSINSLIINREKWDKEQHEKTLHILEQHCLGLNQALEKLTRAFSKQRFYVLTNTACLDMKTGILFPNFDNVRVPEYSLLGFRSFMAQRGKAVSDANWSYGNWAGKLLSAEDLGQLFSSDNPYISGVKLPIKATKYNINVTKFKLKNYLGHINAFSTKESIFDAVVNHVFYGSYLLSSEFSYNNGKYWAYSMKTGRLEQTSNEDILVVAIGGKKLFAANSRIDKALILALLDKLAENNIMFWADTDKTYKELSPELKQCVQDDSVSSYFTENTNKKFLDQLKFDTNKDAFVLNEKRTRDMLTNSTLLENSDKITGVKSSSQMQQINTQSVIGQLLDCDHKRANISSYPLRLLTDINAGHWELYEQITAEPKQKNSLKKDLISVKLSEPLVARPPQLDIHQSGICAIDFGTKSTVVACRDRTEQLLRVGKGDWSKAPVPEDYENPTAIELRDLQSFLAAYDAREGRPFTEWEQMTVSHQALARLLENMDQISAQSVFAELKEWANSKGSLRKLRDGQGREVVLKPYGELDEKKDFDPIEKYAYYLGLYINNMNTGIYMDYVLSYPVTYPVEVRDHLVRSFTRGLKKSLPPALLADKEAMEDFRVYAGASEPAAYAACALKEMGKHDKKMRPTSEQPLFYAVFDFGGGTTDFDYGLWRLPNEDERGYNFVIEHFDAGGDPYLGGENLLRQMAYTVFTKNLDIMRKEQISLSLPPECQPFAGAELLLNDSDAAQLNLRRLSEALRPLWETSVQGEKALGNSKLAVKLFTEKEPVEVQLQADAKELLALLKARIASGVDNFFVNLEHAFAQRLTGKQPQVHILLAGNSCKSPLVKELFDEKIKKASKEFEQILLENSGEEASAAQFFVLHAPLGAGEPDPNELDRIPTGKTGVAFGLIDCRKGGNDVKVIRLDEDSSREAPFRYYLGRIGRFDEFEVLIGKKVGYGLWAPYIHIDDDRFELWYTAEAKALEGGYGPNDLPTPKKCRLHYHKGISGGQVYLRKVGPTKVEYTVGTQEGLAKDEFLADVGSCELEG